MASRSAELIAALASWDGGMGEDAGLVTLSADILTHLQEGGEPSRLELVDGGLLAAAAAGDIMGERCRWIARGGVAALIDVYPTRVHQPPQPRAQGNERASTTSGTVSGAAAAPPPPPPIPPPPSPSTTPGFGTATIDAVTGLCRLVRNTCAARDAAAAQGAACRSGIHEHLAALFAGSHRWNTRLLLAMMTGTGTGGPDHRGGTGSEREGEMNNRRGCDGGGAGVSGSIGGDGIDGGDGGDVDGEGGDGARERESCDAERDRGGKRGDQSDEQQGRAGEQELDALRGKLRVMAHVASQALGNLVVNNPHSRARVWSVCFPSAFENGLSWDSRDRKLTGQLAMVMYNCVVGARGGAAWHGEEGGGAKDGGAKDGGAKDGGEEGGATDGAAPPRGVGVARDDARRRLDALARHAGLVGLLLRGLVPPAPTAPTTTPTSSSSEMGAETKTEARAGGGGSKAAAGAGGAKEGRDNDKEDLASTWIMLLLGLMYDVGLLPTLRATLVLVDGGIDSCNARNARGARGARDARDARDGGAGTAASTPHSLRTKLTKPPPACPPEHVVLLRSFRWHCQHDLEAVTLGPSCAPDHTVCSWSVLAWPRLFSSLAGWLCDLEGSGNGDVDVEVVERGDCADCADTMDTGKREGANSKEDQPERGVFTVGAKAGVAAALVVSLRLIGECRTILLQIIADLSGQSNLSDETNTKTTINNSTNTTNLTVRGGAVPKRTLCTEGVRRMSAQSEARSEHEHSVEWHCRLGDFLRERAHAEGDVLAPAIGVLKEWLDAEQSHRNSKTAGRRGGSTAPPPQQQPPHPPHPPHPSFLAEREEAEEEEEKEREEEEEEHVPLPPTLTPHAVRVATRVVANVCDPASPGRRPPQDRVRELGGVHVVLSCCRTNAQIPFLREWALLAVRNVCGANEENQALVARLEPQQEAQTAEMAASGISAQMDVFGNIRVGAGGMRGGGGAGGGGGGGGGSVAEHGPGRAVHLLQTTQ